MAHVKLCHSIQNSRRLLQDASYEAQERLIRDLPREPTGLHWIGPRAYFRATGWERFFDTLRFAVGNSVSESLSLIRQPVLLRRCRMHARRGRDGVKEEIGRLTGLAWEAYLAGRKSARTQPVAPESGKNRPF